MRIIAGTARNRRIDAPEGKNTRPTLDRVRENLFNILQTRIASSVVLDLFAGSGALSLESLSRGASFAVMCDLDRNANRVERKNTESLGFSGQTELYCCDWKTAVRKLTERGMLFDLIFLDPPYRMDDLREVFDRLVPLLQDDGLVIVEHEGGKTFLFGDRFEITDERKWGFCGVSFLKKIQDKSRMTEKGEKDEYLRFSRVF